MKVLIRIGEWIKRRFFPIHFDAQYHSAEQYYAGIYLEHIRRHLPALSNGTSLRILDAGCGTGRFLMPLAEQGCQVTGVEFHKDSLRITRDKITSKGLDATVIDADLSKAISGFDAATYDVVLCIEVLYVNQQFEEILRECYRVLKPGGLLVATHRPPSFYINQCLATGNFNDALTVTTSTEGRLRKGRHRVYYNWQTKSHIEQLYSRLGMPIAAMHPIGPHSGFLTDPMRSVCDVEAITTRQREALRQIETAAGDDLLMASRYVLVIAHKT